MHDAGIAINQNGIAIQRLGGNAAGMDDKRDGQGPRDDGGVTSDRSFLQHHSLEAAAIVQQIGRSDVARDENGILGHVGPGIAALPCQDAQQPVRQIIKVVQAIAQIGIGDAFQPRPGR